MSMIGCFKQVEDEKIEELLEDPESIYTFLDDDYDPNDKSRIDVDKAWHGIHFLLCDEVWEGTPPLNFVVGGGQIIGDEDVGYGPARAFTSKEVEEIAKALEPLNRSELLSRFKADKFREAEIYPDIWDEPVDQCLGYVLDYFESLKDFVGATATGGKGMLVWIE